MDGIGLDWILLDPPYPVAFYPIEPSVMEVPSDPVGVPRGGTNAGTIATEPEGPLQRLNRLKKSTNSPEKVEEDARADHGARRPLQGQRRGRGARNEGTRRSTRRRKIAKSSDRGGQANEKGGTTRELRGISAHRNTGKWESHLWNPKVKRKGGRRKTGVQVYLGQVKTAVRELTGLEPIALTCCPCPTFSALPFLASVAVLDTGGGRAHLRQGKAKSVQERSECANPTGCGGEQQRTAG
uniref:Uncharacterized protein n=1 Tax=Chloropicon primus TaxID=1764295 RepID=A0A7S2T7V5_9CHLO|mmetsp:Transcript_876/g.2599  ORF Transcript_876/g.2599 Transcript_876/m.2599 type:complete len:240 (+) Transcript_876:163-882(+)